VTLQVQETAGLEYPPPVRRRPDASLAPLLLLVVLACGCAIARSGLATPADTDAALPEDLGARDAGPLDLSVADLGTDDAGASDLGMDDLGLDDLGVDDLGAMDAATADLGSDDAGTPDLGAEDLGAADLGAPDLGPATCDPELCPGRVCVTGACGFATSCAALLAAVPGLPDGLYTIDGDGPGGLLPADALCDMTTSGGGWTLALKADGARPTFAYDAPVWTDDGEFGTAALDGNEAKLRTYRTVGFTALRLVLVTGAERRAVEMVIDAASARALFAGPSRDTGVSRTTWLGLVPDARLQDDCNDEGVNVAPAGGFARVRLGIVANNENNCSSPDSRLGLGGAGGADGAFAVGNVNPDAGWSWGDDSRRIASFAYLFVR
jgi:hypothetical protein